MSLPRYPTYKDSGVEWLGEVPGHWVVSRLGRQLRARSGTDEKSEDGAIPLYGANGVIGFADAASLPSGTVLVGRVGSAGSVTRAAESCAASDNALVLTPGAGVVDAFLFYLVASLDLTALISNTAQPLLTGTLLLAQRVAFPPRPEQAHIAAFLDRETTKIDALVAEQQRLIALLKEKRQAVISHAVTKGLNPDAPMKDSGIEWLGEVPAHWEVGPVKRYFASCDGRRVPLSSEERSGRTGEFPYYGASGIIDWIDAYIFDEDLVLVSEDGANLLNRATPIAFVATGKYWVNNHAHILRPKDSGSFLFWAQAIETIDLTPFVTGSAQPKLTAEALNNLHIAVPPTEAERSAIQSHIVAQSGAIDTLTTEAQLAIDLLQERRTALISAAVTGQIDVRRAAERAAA